MAAVIGGTDVQHAIVAGAGARAVDSNGNPWQGSYITASGNLLADFTANANAEMQGRVQVARLYHMTDDHGVKQLLSFLLARDTMHQNQWIQAAAELRAEGRENLPVPSNFPLKNEHREAVVPVPELLRRSRGGRRCWASGPTPDGHGEFSYHDGPTTSASDAAAHQARSPALRHHSRSEPARQGHGCRQGRHRQLTPPVAPNQENHDHRPIPT